MLQPTSAGAPAGPDEGGRGAGAGAGCQAPCTTRACPAEAAGTDPEEELRVHPDDSAASDGLSEGPDREVLLDAVIEDAGHSGRGRLTVLRFTWRREDPLAVGLVLSAQPDHPALPRGGERSDAALEDLLARLLQR